VSGIGLRPALLSGSVSNMDFSSLEVGVASGTMTWTVTNTGDVATSALSFSNSNAQEISVSSPNPCASGTLIGGASCSVMVAFKPTAGGSRGGTLTVSAATGGAASVDVKSNGLYRLTVVPTGVGTVSSVPAGISCGATCSGLFPAGPLTLQARPTNGSGYRFAGWSGSLLGGGCPGVLRDCSFSLTASTSVTATFAQVANNLIFVTQATYSPTTLTNNTATHDAKCNAAATAAGINDATGSSFVAFTSSSTSLASARLGSARGWVLMNGKPYTDTLTAFFTNHVMWNANNLDETGTAITGQGTMVATGTSFDGTLATGQTCSDWSVAVTGTYMMGGLVIDGPALGYGNVLGQCSNTYNLMCMGKTKTAAVSPVVTTGRKIWVSRPAYAFGVQTPDAFCQADRPAGVTTAAALIATTSRAPVGSLSLTMNYVRVDGTLVGTGQQLVNSSLGTGLLESGIWQQSDGTYDINSPIWTGSTDLNSVGTVASTCNNWTDPSTTTATIGTSTTIVQYWWATPNNFCNNVGAHLFCVQTSP